MQENLRVKIGKEKTTKESFLVALIPALSLPSDLPTIDDTTNCAVIATNESDGNEVYGYVHLQDGEKQAIGEALENSCAELNTWYWCELYTL